MLGIVAAEHVDARTQVEPFAHRFRRQVQLVGWQQRAFDVVAALFVALARLRPELVGGVADAFAEDGQGAFAEVIEQRRGLREEQRQVVLDAGRRRAGLEVLEQAAAAGVDVEAVAQRVHRALQRCVVQRHFAAGQQLHGFGAVERALRFRIERADGVDDVVEQFHAIRLRRAHRIDVEQAAAHGEVARVEDLRDVAVAGRFQAALLGVEVEPLADLHVEAVADHVTQRRQPLHQGRDRNHDDAALQAGRRCNADRRCETMSGCGLNWS